jgi:hypothetical protein
MKVVPTQIAETVVPRTGTRAENADKSAFKSTLAKASTDKSAEITLRKGEAMTAVEGHAYSEVTSGAREGMYVNTSGNVRHGQAFVLVRKNGKEYHVYGSGKDRLVVGFHMPTADKTETPEKTPAVDTSDLKLRKGEKAEPVEGHAYAEITAGAREGMYINTSGNERHGEAFVLSLKAGVEYHIYGSGADREVVSLQPRDEDDDE